MRANVYIILYRKMKKMLSACNFVSSVMVSSPPELIIVVNVTGVCVLFNFLNSIKLVFHVFGNFIFESYSYFSQMRSEDGPPLPLD